jgi:hypothetical protein
MQTPRRRGHPALLDDYYKTLQFSQFHNRTDTTSQTAWPANYRPSFIAAIGDRRWATALLPRTTMLRET